MRFIKPRMTTRFRSYFPVEFEGDGVSGHGTVMNLSSSGCGIESSQPLHGKYLTLTLILPEQESPITVELAAVRWAGEQMAGLEFIRMRREEQTRVQQVLPA